LTNLSRRRLLAGVTFLVPAALIGCAGALTPAQLVADAQGAVTALQTALPAIAAVAPTIAAALPRLTGYLTTAQTLLNGLAGAVPATTGATTLASVEADLNAVLDALAAVPLIPPPYDAVIAAVALVAPELEAFVNSMAAASGAATLPMALRLRAAYRLIRPGMTLPQMRAILHVPTV
jgi:hypothetical protein